MLQIVPLGYIEFVQTSALLISMKWSNKSTIKMSGSRLLLWIQWSLGHLNEWCQRGTNQSHDPLPPFLSLHTSRSSSTRNYITHTFESAVKQTEVLVLTQCLHCDMQKRLLDFAILCKVLSGFACCYYRLQLMLKSRLLFFFFEISNF